MEGSGVFRGTVTSYVKKIQQSFNYSTELRLEYYNQPTNQPTNQPNQTKPNQTKPNQTKPNQTKSNQTKPNQTKPNQNQNQTKPNQTNQPTNRCLETVIAFGASLDVPGRKCWDQWWSDQWVMLFHLLMNGGDSLGL